MDRVEGMAVGLELGERVEPGSADGGIETGYVIL